MKILSAYPDKINAPNSENIGIGISAINDSNGIRKHSSTNPITELNHISAVMHTVNNNKDNIITD
jgi:hypothetical protein